MFALIISHVCEEILLQFAITREQERRRICEEESRAEIILKKTEQSFCGASSTDEEEPACSCRCAKRNENVMRANIEKFEIPCGNDVWILQSIGKNGGIGKQKLNLYAISE